MLSRKLYEMPPIFNGSNCNYWKVRMIIYQLYVDYNLWDVVVKGSYISRIIIDGVTDEKSSEEWDENDQRLYSMNAKVVNILYYGLNTDDYRIYKEI